MNIFSRNFDVVTEEDEKVMEEYFHGFDYRGAGYTFLANYIWRTTQCLCWEVIDGYLCIAGADCIVGEPSAIVSMPLTKDGTYDPKKLRSAVLEMKRRFDERKIPFRMILVPGHMRKFLEEAFPGQVEFTHNRNADEYVYLKEKLITLSGRALHKKKNHLNYFLKTYSYEARPLKGSDLDDVMALTAEIQEARDYGEDEGESLRMEAAAIEEAMAFVEKDDIYSVGIYIDGKLKAFSIGERLWKDTAVAHFEKASDDYRGLYQLVAREFCLGLPEEIVYVNREEDMGLENLRQAKEALRPDHMEEKYSCCFFV